MAKVNKILMLVENMPAPLDRRVWSEAMTLRNHGFQVSVISPKGSKQYRESYICIDGIHIYRYNVPQVGPKYIAYLLEYSVALLMTLLLSFKVLFRHGFDVIHTANPPDIFFAIGLFYRLLGKKFVFDQHDLTPELFRVMAKGRMKPIYKLMLFLERCTYRTANLVIVANESFRKIAMKRDGCADNQVFVVRNGPNLKQMKVVAPEPELKKGYRYLLAYVGLMAVQDGVEYALYALHELVYKRGRQDVALVMMGDGDYAPTLRKLIHELNLDEQVNFLGWTESKDILRYLSIADVGLTPDPKNGLNEFCTMIKTMEYMAMAKPVVSFDLIEARFSAQAAALYATPNSVEDFANKIEMLLDNEELRLKLGAIGRQRIEEELSWDESTKNLLQAYAVLFPGNLKAYMSDRYSNGSASTRSELPSSQMKS
jgi:glycosyltransferase involved in cell wall biosynthesis